MDATDKVANDCAVCRRRFHTRSSRGKTLARSRTETIRRLGAFLSPILPASSYAGTSEQHWHRCCLPPRRSRRTSTVDEAGRIAVARLLGRWIQVAIAQRSPCVCPFGSNVGIYWVVTIMLLTMQPSVWRRRAVYRWALYSDNRRDAIPCPQDTSRQNQRTSARQETLTGRIKFSFRTSPNCAVFD